MSHVRLRGTNAWLLGGSAALGAAGLAVIAVAVSGMILFENSPEGQALDDVAAAELVERSARDTLADDGVEDLARPEAVSAISELASPAWVAQQAERTGVPPRALTAYAGAEIRLAAEQPGCGVDWGTLAAIGHIESSHGTLHGGSIAEDGLQTPAIFGIVLDGTSTDAIRDTDGGALDGDAVWDRAVGPMQIIPETWARFAADGNGDGQVDPQQIDDAALTAARYLCAVGADLRTSDGWIAAISAYNSTTDYNNRVAEAARFYQQG